MSPAGGKYDVAVGGQSLEAGIAVDMQHALEVFQMRGRTFRLAVGREQEDRRRRLGSAPWPLFARIDPKSPRFRAPAAGIEHRNWRIVGKEMVGSEDILAQPLVQGFQPPAGAADPAGQRRTRKIDAVPGKDLRLTIERRVIAILGDQHLREQRRRRHAAGNWTFRGRRLGDRAASATGVLWTGDAQDAKRRRNPIQHLAHAFADGMERAAAASARLAVDIEPDVLARQMIGQRFAPGLRLARRFFHACLDRRMAFANARDIAVRSSRASAIWSGSRRSERRPNCARWSFLMMS